MANKNLYGDAYESAVNSKSEINLILKEWSFCFYEQRQFMTPFQRQWYSYGAYTFPSLL